MNTFFADYTKNISKGGTFIKTDRPLPVGTEFSFKLALPKRDAPFELQRRGHWSNRPSEIQNPEVSRHGHGYPIHFPDDVEREAFEGQVEALMVDSSARTSTTSSSPSHRAPDWLAETAPAEPMCPAMPPLICSL